jgi:hypothetical protein
MAVATSAGLISLVSKYEVAAAVAPLTTPGTSPDRITFGQLIACILFLLPIGTLLVVMFFSVQCEEARLERTRRDFHAKDKTAPPLSRLGHTAAISAVTDGRWAW